MNVRVPSQPARWGAWRVLAAGFVVFLGMGLPVPAAEAPVADPAAGTASIPEVKPPRICPEERTLCVESRDEGDYDARAGVAELRGDVRGYIRESDLAFSSDRLRAMRSGKSGVRRLELYGAVRASEPGRFVSAENAIIERSVATMYGKVHLEETGYRIQGDEVVLDHDAQRVTIRGTPANPLTMVADGSASDPPGDAGTSPSVGETKEGGVQVAAQRAILEDENKTVLLTGAVHMQMPAKQIGMDAESVTLTFAEDGSVSAFSARGNVVIVQPGRRLSSDSARSLNRMQTILLLGKAHMAQEGQFDLNSDRLEVFADAQRGAVHSEDRQKPMNLSLDINALRGWKLDTARMTKLRDQGLPSSVLKKLEPLQGRSFPTQSAFEQAATERIGPDDSERYLSKISSQARP